MRPGLACVPDQAEVEGGHGWGQGLGRQARQRRGQVRLVLARPHGTLALRLHAVLVAHLQRYVPQLLRLPRATLLT